MGSDKIINVTRSSMPPYEEFINKIKPLWESAWLTNMGELHQALERDLKGYLGVEKLLLFSNGHMALEMMIQALGISGEVITTPFSFASTTHAIVRNNLTPVFCDINAEDYTMDTSQLEDLITERTTAIVPVHVYGNICNLQAIQDIAGRHGLKVVYDAAHAFGVTVDGQGIGTFGDASMFSFHATKVFHTIEGGAVTFCNQDFEVLLNYLKNFGITGKESVEYVGGNAKMNELQAAMGLCNLEYIEEELEKRRRVVERYRENLEGVKGLKLNAAQTGVKSNYAYFPVVFDGFKRNRNEVYDCLAKENIFARKYFYPLISDFKCYKDKYDSSLTPVARHIADRVLTLPCYADLDLESVDRICRIILNPGGIYE